MGLGLVASSRRSLMEIPFELVEDTFCKIIQDLHALTSEKFDFERKTQDVSTWSSGARRDLSELTGTAQIFNWIHAKFSELLLKVHCELSVPEVATIYKHSSSSANMCDQICKLQSMGSGMSPNHFESVLFNILSGNDFCIHGGDPDKIREYMCSLRALHPQGDNVKHTCVKPEVIKATFEDMQVYVLKDYSSESKLVRQVSKEVH